MPFTPIQAVIGGLAIGTTVFWNARLNGKVTGISGTLNTALTGDAFSFAFITGLISGGIMFKHLITTPFASESLHTVPYQRLVLAGFLVGLGTRLGNGCTSGHGVCGLSRLSRRSFVSVSVFMLVAAFVATTFHSSQFFRQRRSPGMPFSLAEIPLPPSDELPWMLTLLLCSAVVPPVIALISEYVHDEAKSMVKETIQYVLGLSFAAGLIISGMANPAKTVSFLDLEAPAWDPSLSFVFVGALPLAFVGFRPLLHGVKPALAANHSLPSRTDIDIRLVAGAVLFGIGWGMVGLCPGPALVYFGAFPFSFKTTGFALAMGCGSIICKGLMTGYDKWVS